MPILPSLNSIKSGLTLIIEKEPYLVLEASFMRTAQRKPVMRTKLRHLKTGKVREMSFKPGDTVEEAEVEKRKTRYLYADERFAYFMDEETFVEHSLPKEELLGKLQYLKEGEEVSIMQCQGEMITIEVPVKVALRITSCPPAVRGDTAQGGVTKEAEVETGAKIRVPLFIKEGDTVMINTETGQYVERV